MVKQTNTNVAGDAKNRNEHDTLAVLERISQLLSLNNPKQSETKTNDDLIASLSETRENQRVRQVVECEKTRRHNHQRAA
jgi:hypothetical protein